MWKGSSNHIDVNRFELDACMMQQTWLSLSTKNQRESDQFVFFKLLFDYFGFIFPYFSSR